MLDGVWAVTLTLALQNAQTGAPSIHTIWSDDQPFTRIVQNLGEDFRGLATWETLTIVSAGGAGAFLLHPVDDEVAAWVVRQEYSSYTPVGRNVGDAWFQVGAAIGAYAIGKLSHDAKVTHIGSDLIRAQVVNGLITQGLKVTSGRNRPGGGDHSFPSGHSSAAFTSAGVLHGHFGWKVGVPAYAISGFIGWARFRDNSHWVSDVVFGSALGVAVGRAVVRGHRRSSWTVMPTATRGSAAVYIIKK